MRKKLEVKDQVTPIAEKVDPEIVPVVQRSKGAVEIPAVVIKTLGISFCVHKEGDYCELENESDPNSQVLFRRKNGAVFMMMPREDFEELWNKSSGG